MVECYFPKKKKTKYYPVKERVNGTNWTMLFSQKRAKLKIAQSKVALTIQLTGYSAIFPGRGGTKSQAVKFSFNGTRLQCYFREK